MSKTDRILEGLLTRDPEQAMTVFELSRDDKQMYRRIIGGRQPKDLKKANG